MSEIEFDLDIQQPAEKPVGIVDADSIMYNLGWYYDKAGLLPEGFYEDTTTIVPENIKKAVYTFLDTLQEDMGVDTLHLHFTSGEKTAAIFEEFTGRKPKPQFRQTLGNPYKANRKDAPIPSGYHFTLRTMLELPHTYIHDQWEADEAVILHKKLYPNTVLSSNDKDVYKQHYGKNWMYDKRKKWVEIDKDFANYFAFLQTITGDPTDGFIGVKGLGEKKAEKFVSPHNTPTENWQGVLDAFESNGLTEADAIMNMRFASMHQLKLDAKGEPTIDLWKPEGHHMSPVWK